MQKDEKLEKDEVLFKAIEKEETHIKAEHNASANFALTRSNIKSQRRAFKDKKEVIEWPKCKKYGCKHLANQVCKHANEECEKCHKKGHISLFYNSYSSLNKRKNPDKSIPSNLDSKKNMSCVTQIIVNKIFETGVIQKIIVDFSTI